MKDLKKMVLLTVEAILIVWFSFSIDLANYYHLHFFGGANRLFSGDVYTQTYFWMLVLVVIAFHEFIETIKEGLDQKQIHYLYGILVVIGLACWFSTILTLFKYIIVIYLVVEGLKMKNKH